jgi:hypothetical protein
MPLYNPATAAPASQIATSGTPVSIGNTPPSANQVLTASSATAAAWTAPSGGGFSSYIKLPAEVTISSTTLTDIPGFSWSLQAGVSYEFWFQLFCYPTGGQPTIAIGPAYTSAEPEMLVSMMRNFQNNGPISQSAINSGMPAFGFPANQTLVNAQATWIQGVITTDAAGTFTLQAKTSDAGTSFGIQRYNTMGRVFKV